ncbi:hypothetical protein AYI68_g7155 [Smittium mucronatum]|uniref:Uncharacterized protein n=1 Tax=Smittium mucronatum TaxID=133383 RepID=A0A1R0GPF7_9FUNG|nr:hypothetical protein AYI68_g7155 [Smittium mucronatum]
MPITVEWNFDSLEIPAKKIEINANRILLSADQSIKCNRFSPLIDADMDLNQLPEGLIDNEWTESKRLQFSTAATEVWSKSLSKKTISTIKNRRSKFRDYRLGKIDKIDTNYWRTIKPYTGNTHRRISDGPVYDKNKNIITEKNKKLEIWNNRFGELANDSNGNNRGATKWESQLITDCDYFPECDTSIKWSDITMELSDTPNNKAPCSDGITSEVRKLVVSKKISGSKMAKIIFKIINIMYDSGGIPANMNTSIVVPVPKKRDIKAYDRVPHTALFCNLKAIGIGGKLIKAIWGLYRSPKLAVRIEDDVSKPTDYLCGLQQGCPASPILFDL